MTKDTIDDVWCVVATPYRELHPITKKGGRSRRASGEKGLGRLSAARLGKSLEMLTKSPDEPCWKVTVDWATLSNLGDIRACFINRELHIGPTPFGQTGTRVRILNLNSEWDDDKIDDLKDNLSRLVSPFSTIKDFRIYFTPPGESAMPVEIEAPDFLSRPPYRIRGTLRRSGLLVWEYDHSPIKGRGRTVSKNVAWSALREELDIEGSKKTEFPKSGPFNFEIRAWDIGREDITEIAARFDLQRASIRRSIKAFKGISLYRDGILVLPKSDTARDWLGLDLRRVAELEYG